MNAQQPSPPADLNSLLMLDELAAGEPISQREIAGRLGIALGLVNSYLKTLVHKGYVQVKTCPRNRYAYLLTPSGIAEKSRYAYQQVAHYHKLFLVTRQDSLIFFQGLHVQGVRNVAFCGVDEFTEIAYLSLREAGIGLLGVMDERRFGQRFLDLPIHSLAEGRRAGWRPVVVTSLREGRECREKLLGAGVEEGEIFMPVDRIL
jgi:DNA-binding MarR family transcriptional regulator